MPSKVSSKKTTKRGKMAAQSEPAAESEASNELAKPDPDSIMNATFNIPSKDANVAIATADIPVNNEDREHEDIIEEEVEKIENTSEEDEEIAAELKPNPKKKGRPAKNEKKKENATAPIVDDIGDGDKVSPSNKRASDEVAADPPPKRGRKKATAPVPKKVAAPKRGRKVTKGTEEYDEDSNEELAGEVEPASDVAPKVGETKEESGDEDEETEEPPTEAPKTKPVRKVKIESPKQVDDEEEESEPKPKGKGGKRGGVAKSKAVTAPVAPTRPTRARKNNVVYTEPAEEDDLDDDVKKPKKAAVPKKKGRAAKKDDEGAEATENVEVPARKKAAARRGRPKKEEAEVEEELVADEAEVEEN